jgi:hypothetical protein
MLSSEWPNVEGEELSTGNQEIRPSLANFLVNQSLHGLPFAFSVLGTCRLIGTSLEVRHSEPAYHETGRGAGEPLTFANCSVRDGADGSYTVTA